MCGVERNDEMNARASKPYVYRYATRGQKNMDRSRNKEAKSGTVDEAYLSQGPGKLTIWRKDTQNGM